MNNKEKKLELSGPKFIHIFGFNVFNDNLSNIKLDHDTKVITCISPNNYGLTTKDPEFKLVMQNTDIIILDGVYFALASILLHGKNIKRNQGPDVFDYFIKYLNRTKGKAFFLGSSELVLEKIKQRAAIEYPNVEVDYLSPPFKPEFSDEDNKLMIEKINAFKPDILFVGMTTPKQDKWAIKQREKVDTKLIVGIGNVFDWYARTQKRIHPIWFKLRLGWLIRIFLRPEIFKRNIGNQMIFFRHLFLALIGIKKFD